MVIQQLQTVTRGQERIFLSINHRSYFADKINTPLLLIHGTSDTNVPIVESDQIFTALKVLGKEVEYVRFFGEDHGINSKPSVRIASEVLMLEWFDKYLKVRRKRGIIGGKTNLKR